MAKDSRSKWERVLWNDINVRLLRHVQLAGNKYMLAAAYLLHISPVIRSYEFLKPSQLPLFTLRISKTASQAICYQLYTHRILYALRNFYILWQRVFVLSLSAPKTRLVSKSQSLGKPHSNTVHVRLTTALLSVALLVTCRKEVNVSGFDSRRGLIMVVSTATTLTLGTIQSKFGGHRASVLQDQNYQVLKPTTGLYRVPWRRMCEAVPPLRMRVHVILLN